MPNIDRIALQQVPALSHVKTHVDGFLGRFRVAKDAFLQENCLVLAIKKAWDAFSIRAQLWRLKIYHFWESLVTTPFPSVNSNLTKAALLGLYWGLGKENKWMECIDGRYHYLGKMVFDKGLHAGTVEPGFVASMEKAFLFVERSLGQKIDANWYLNLHRQTASHFNEDRSVFLMGQEKVGVFRDGDDLIHCYLNGAYTVSKEAKAEFESLNRELERELGPRYGLGEMTYTDSFFNSARLNYKKMNRLQVQRVFNKFLGDFYKEIEKPHLCSENKLYEIARLHQRLEWLHPVKDGTSRTSIALLNKLLTDHGFHPAILDYPHVSSSYPLQKWKDYLKSGLLRWEHQKMYNTIVIPRGIQKLGDAKEAP